MRDSQCRSDVVQPQLVAEGIDERHHKTEQHDMRMRDKLAVILGCRHKDSQHQAQNRVAEARHDEFPVHFIPLSLLINSLSANLIQPFATFPLKQMLAIKHRYLQRKGIDTIHAPEVHDVLTRPARRLAEGGDAAILAEMMFRLHPAPLVGAQRAFLRVELELLARHQADHRPALGTIRAVAADTLRDRLRLERELDRAAVATAFIWLHDHFFCYIGFIDLTRCRRLL